MNEILKRLNGYKTYLAVLVWAGLQIYEKLGNTVDPFVYQMVYAWGGFGIAHKLSKISDK